jgi:hypothetical protein
MTEPPRIRKEFSYPRYATLLNIEGPKGYTISPVAALWMSVGFFAPFLAGLYVSMTIFLFLLLSRMPTKKFWPSFSLPAIALGGASIPVILSRSGPEGIWGVFINVLALPSIFLLLPMNIHHMPNFRRIFSKTSDSKYMP